MRAIETGTAYPNMRLPVLFILILFFVFAVGCLASAEESALPTDDSKGIYYKEGLLKVSVEKQKFIKVMEEITRTAGIKFISKDYANDEVTIHFDYLPLEEGLRQIIVDKNYIFFYQSVDGGSPARLSTVFILPERGAGTEITSEAAGLHDANKPAEQQNEASSQQDMAEILDSLNEAKEFSDALKQLEEEENIKALLQSEGDDISKVPDEIKSFRKQTEGLEQTIKENLKKQNQTYPQ